MLNESKVQSSYTTTFSNRIWWSIHIIRPHMMLMQCGGWYGRTDDYKEKMWVGSSSTVFLSRCFFFFLYPRFSSCVCHLSSNQLNFFSVFFNFFILQSQIIKDRGYPVEEHFVTTKDGFILNIQRIPQGRQRETSAGSKPVVFLQHGLLMDSTNWVLNSPSNSLGYILADNGYDVWLGNIRGNAYSQRHKNLEKTQSEFWNWRFVIAFFCK